MDDFNSKVRIFLSSLTHFHAVPEHRDDVCQVCCGPTGTSRANIHYPFCTPCRSTRSEAGAAGAKLANHTAFVTYALQYWDEATKSKSSDMALDDMYAYKDPERTPWLRNAAAVRITSLLYSALHSLESQDHLGGPFTVITFVPSSAGAGPSPLSEVVERALAKINETPGFGSILDWTPGKDRAERRFDPDKFTVAQPGLVRDKRVLLIEDTWVSGAKAQSAAAALLKAGASWVTILSVARMLDEKYDAGEYLRNRYRKLPPPTIDSSN